MAALWWCFVGTGPYADPTLPPPPDVSLGGRAAWWLDMGGFGGPFATLTTLVAFGWASARRRSEGAVESVMTRMLGLALACVMAIVQVGGLVAVVIGSAQLLNSTGGYDPWTTLNRFQVSEMVSSLVLAVLFVVLAWVLRSRPVADAVWPGSDLPEEDNEIRWESKAAEPVQPSRGRPED